MEPNPEVVATLISLGYSQAQVLQALQISENNAETALELLSSGCIEEPAQLTDNKIQPKENNLFSNIFNEERYKMVALVRTDLGMGIGKIAAQVAHACVHAYRTAEPRLIERWDHSGDAKIVLKVDSLEELLEYSEKAKAAGINTAIIKDAGRTQVEPGTTTVCAIGPESVSKIDAVTGKLRLL
ncbi:unnamed protein product [Blepharisma stoltei]|uniref:peptidyl-tRNA hydrolase n=1 Tax=Blepharisma stoltei TaxID=1481888 RepID=A0AAU9K4M4_9CILI|nr:unnamed protein product [Blepharisma stoltei]